MATLGDATDGTDTSTAPMVGTTAAQAVLDYRHNDGASQLNGYADTCQPACYQPVNACACPPPARPHRVHARCSDS